LPDDDETDLTLRVLAGGSLSFSSDQQFEQ
jgi:hypothetical protein